MAQNYSFNNIPYNVHLGANLMLADFSPKSVKTSPATYAKISGNDYTRVIDENVENQEAAVEDSSVVKYLQTPYLINVSGVEGKPIMLTDAMFKSFATNSSHMTVDTEASEFLEQAAVTEPEEIVEEDVAFDAQENTGAEEDIASDAQENTVVEEPAAEENISSDNSDEDVSFDFETETSDENIEQSDISEEDKMDLDPDAEVEYNFNIDDIAEEEKEPSKSVEDNENIAASEEMNESGIANETPEEDIAVEAPKATSDTYETSYVNNNSSDINENINILSSFSAHKQELDAAISEKRAEKKELLAQLGSLEETINEIEKNKQDAIEKVKKAYQDIEPALNLLGVDVKKQFGIEYSDLGINNNEQYEDNSYQR